MQQTSLNIIAIGVFTITLSSLLSPILNISPTIPAGITLGIMGLATIDTLGWQNKGITLFLDLFTSSQQRQRIIHHEAGHFLTAYFLGIPIIDYNLTAWEAFKQGNPGQGGVIFNTEILWKTAYQNKEIPLTLERFCTVLMAGIAAETIYYGDSQGSTADYQKLQETLNFTGVPASNYTQKASWAQLQATNLIKKYSTSYEALVEAMTNRASVEECYQIIQKYCQDPI